MTKAKGNMYENITHTHNVIKGICPHGCTYCYMNKLYERKWLEPKKIYFDEKELNKNLGSGNIIFIGSSCDMWARNIPDKWLFTILNKIRKYPENTYLFQSKNPSRFLPFFGWFPEYTKLGTTIETNRLYPCMGKTIHPHTRALSMENLQYNNDCFGFELFITIEPILDFDIKQFVKQLKCAKPDYINIGADSGNNNLPEPPKEKIHELINELEKFTKVHLKQNINRIIGGTQ